MFAIQISDPGTFVKKAKKLQIPVKVVRTWISVPVQEGAALMMRPALSIYYALEFEDKEAGETRWTYREVLLTDDNGEVSLAKAALLEQLKEASARVQLLHPSGSV